MYFDNFVNLYIFSIFYNTKFRRGLKKSIDLFKIDMFLISIVEKTYLPIEMELFFDYSLKVDRYKACPLSTDHTSFSLRVVVFRFKVRFGVICVNRYLKFSQHTLIVLFIWYVFEFLCGNFCTWYCCKGVINYSSPNTFFLILCCNVWVKFTGIAVICYECGLSTCEFFLYNLEFL